MLRPPKHPENDQIPQYVRLTSVLRNRLQKGEWKPGDQIPRIDDLAREYGLGRNTIRQALGLLSNEGLIASTRGSGTFVQKTADLSFHDKGLIEAINDPLAMGPDQTIKVLKRERVRELPEALRGNAPLYDEYVRVFKIHFYRDKPFSLQDIYVAGEAYDKFPKNADAKDKILRLVAKAGFKIRTYRQEIVVISPDHETAMLLKYSMAGPMVRITRWRTDHTGLTITAGTYLYRADLFVLNIEEAFPDNKPPGLSWISTGRKPR